MRSVNINQVVHHASPFHLRLALHTWSVTAKTLQSGYHGLGAILDRPSQGLVTVELRMDGKYGSGESLVVDIYRQTSNGDVDLVLSKTVDENSLSGSQGTLDLLTGTAIQAELQAGDSVYAILAYVAGTPNSPTTSLVVQVG